MHDPCRERGKLIDRRDAWISERVMAGDTYPEIAVRLGISEIRLAGIFGRLGLHGVYAMKQEDKRIDVDW